MQNRIIIDSEHYTFHVSKASLAYKDIDRIIQIQESSYNKITTKLDFTSNLHIHYNLVSSPKYCGNEFNKQLLGVGCETNPAYQTNAFAWYPDLVYATYNKTIKAIGCHEDTHLLAYEYFKQLSSRFITEGLAVSFDEYWLGVPVHECSKSIISKNKINPIDLLGNDCFDTSDCLITYPIAGSFCLWLIQVYGMEIMKAIYKESLQNCMYVAEHYDIKEYRLFLNVIK